jgi:hypothetical protein
MYLSINYAFLIYLRYEIKNWVRFLCPNKFLEDYSYVKHILNIILLHFLSSLFFLFILGKK